MMDNDIKALVVTQLVDGLRHIFLDRGAEMGARLRAAELLIPLVLTP